MAKNQGLFPNNVSIVFSKLLFLHQHPTIHHISSSYSPPPNLSLVILLDKYFRKPMFSNKTQDSAEKAEKSPVAVMGA